MESLAHDFGLKNNEARRDNRMWVGTIVYKCNHIMPFARPIADMNGGDGVTIGKMRRIIRTERGMCCPECRK